MRIDWDTPVSELMHSDEGICYIDLPEDAIVHFKYIKKEKLPNGKIRYYYDYDAANAELIRARNARDEAWRKRLVAYSNYDTNKKNLEKIEKYENGKQYTLYDHGMAKAAVSLSSYEYRAAAKKYEDTVKKYERTRIRNIAHETISKGIVAVANLFASIGNLFRKK